MNPLVKNHHTSRKILSLTILGSCLAFPPAYADKTTQPTAALLAVKEPTTELVLSQALALALTGSPKLAAFSQEIRAREAATLQANLLPNPTFGVQASNFANNKLKGPDGDLKFPKNSSSHHA